MSLDAAQRATEILLALAFLQQAAEHVWGSRAAPGLMALRGLGAAALLAGWAAPVVLAGLSLHSVVVLHRFGGPYNGGADRMGLLVLYCLTLSHWLPEGTAQEVAFGYLGVQVVLSYFISGQVKIANPEWRSGQALTEVFRFSAYPVSEDLRGLSDRPRLLWAAGWAVMLFELAFPLALLDHHVLAASLVLAAGFHVANACLFGLNRFVWVWISSYPAILWLQDRAMG